MHADYRRELRASMRNHGEVPAACRSMIYELEEV